MLQYQVDSMKETVNKNLGRSPDGSIVISNRKPPRTVHIKDEHAAFLGVGSTGAKPLNAGVARLPPPPGKSYGSLVAVKLEDLYKALRNAKGVDNPDYDGDSVKAPSPGPGQDQTEHSDNGQESQGVEESGGN